MKLRIGSFLLAGALLLSCAACSNPTDTSSTDTTPPPTASAPAPGEVLITLSDDGITITSSEGDQSGVRLGDEIIYYKDSTDETYGEGDESEKHSAEEAAAHTVVTIDQPGTYRLTGKLSQGQIFVDLGEDAKTDPEAVVTLILDNVDITCTVAPALLFYRVYECNSAWVAYDEEKVAEYTASAVADTSVAGANVILAAGSENNFNGSHVARIYKEGTTKKLHKYDGAFYSKMSMNIYGDDGDDSGILNVVSDNEGMNSEMHLTINGGTIFIESQDDGINTNEDNVSVTTVNGGNLTVNAGLGAEGDGIDSNGYLTINGGTVWTMSNERSPDGGIDADCAITINGGNLYAFGTRNDAADNTSAQPYMELSFASTLPVGTQIRVTDEADNTIWEAVTQKTCQAITLTTPELALNTVYYVFVDDELQCYTGNSFGMMGGFGGGMGGWRPGNMEPPESMDLPENFDPTQIGEPPKGFDPSQMGERPEGFDPEQMGQRPDRGEMLEGMENMAPPENFAGRQDRPDNMGSFGGGQNTGSGETDFILTEITKSFSGVCDSSQSGKTSVTFTVDGITRANGTTAIEQIEAISASASDLAENQIQVTVTDYPSEDYAVSCLLSDGLDAVNSLLPEDAGQYVLTVAVVSGSETHTGATQISFSVEATAE